jgi:hypothetical protein
VIAHLRVGDTERRTDVAPAPTVQRVNVLDLSSCAVDNILVLSWNESIKSCSFSMSILFQILRELAVSRWRTGQDR